MRKNIKLNSRTVLSDGRYKTHQNWLLETEEQEKERASKDSSLEIIEIPVKCLWNDSSLDYINLFPT